MTRNDVRIEDFVIRSETDIAGCDVVVDFPVCGEIFGLFGDVRNDFSVHHFPDHFPIRRFDEAVFIDFGVTRQIVDQTDVLTFRSFDRADSSVVGMMHVADFKRSAIAGQSARTESRESPLIGQFRERVDLIHELGQLAGREEFLDRSD